MFFKILSWALLLWGGWSLCVYNYKNHTQNWERVWINGVLVSLFLAAFTYFTTGMPSCSEWDGGSCIEDANDGYEWTHSKASSKAVTMFLKTVIAGSTALYVFKIKKEMNK